VVAFCNVDHPVWFIAQLTVALPRCANASGNAVLGLEVWLGLVALLVAELFCSPVSVQNSIPQRGLLNHKKI
jgi:hypothetical protein